MSLDALRTNGPVVVDPATVDPGDEQELAVAVNLVAQAVLDLDALVAGLPTGSHVTVLPGSEFAAWLASKGITGPVVIDVAQ